MFLLKTSEYHNNQSCQQVSVSMMSSSEIRELISHMVEGFQGHNSSLFDLSNKCLLISHKKLGAVCHERSDYSENDLSANTENRIYCNVMSCQEVFDNTSSYQSHYNAMHRFICRECKKSLPTEHLLDLHICEVHDFFFAARVTRGDSVYLCFLEECKEKFRNPTQRKEHCIKDHKFPGNFRFNQTSVLKTMSRHPKMHAHSDSTCQIEEGEEQRKNYNVKTFSFGQQKKKTFHLQKQNIYQKDVNRTLEDMDIIKKALDEVPL
ncbi:zinc finger protein 511 lethal (2) k10201 [Glossina fuscipes fuscipes]